MANGTDVDYDVLLEAVAKCSVAVVGVETVVFCVLWHAMIPEAARPRNMWRRLLCGLLKMRNRHRRNFIRRAAKA